MMHNHAENVEKQGYYSSGLSPRRTRHFGLDLDCPTPFGALSRSLRQRNRLAATASASSHAISKALDIDLVKANESPPPCCS